MDINYLGNEELKYELYIRGLPLSGTFSQKRTELREALRLERENKRNPPLSSTYDADSELCLCRSKLISLERDINMQSGDSDFRRLNTLLLHVSFRVNRIHPANEIDIILKDNLLAMSARLTGQVNLASRGIMTSAQKHSAHTDVAKSGSAIAVEKDLISFDEEIPQHQADESVHNNHRLPHDHNSESSHADTNESYHDDVDNSESLNNRRPIVPLQYLNTQETTFQPHSGSASNRNILNVDHENNGLVREIQFSQHRYIPSFERNQPTVEHCENNRYSAPAENHLTNPPNTTYETFVLANNGGQSSANTSFRPSQNSNTGILRSSNPRSEHSNSRVHFQPNVFRPALPQENPTNISGTSLPLEKLINDLQLSPLRGSNFHSAPYLDVSRWNIKFNGQSSVNDFLERIEEIRLSRGVSKDHLLRSCPELLTGDALLWYRTCKFVDWDDLVRQLRESFQPYDYEYALWDEIRRRTQGAQERVLTYLVAMENLFRKLPEMPSDTTKLNIICRNLLPYIQSRLATHQVFTIQELTRLSRAIEETESRLQKFVPPPTNTRQLLEPELAYKKPSYHAAPLHIEPILENGVVQPGTHLDAIKPARPLICWNCDQSGHRFNQCQQAKLVFCYKCGKKQVTSKSCPDCTKNLLVARN